MTSGKPDYTQIVELAQATLDLIASASKQDDMMDKQDDIITRLKKYDFVASDVLEKSDDDEEYGLGSYQEVKSIEFNPIGIINRAAFRIKFDLKAAGGETAYGRIYRNGVAVGTIRSTASTSYTTYSEDISGWSVLDTIELWAASTPGTQVGFYVRNFRVYATIEETTYEASW